MDITVYLPDELGQQAKSAEINLSRMLRDAVTAELQRRQTMTNALKDPQTFELALEGDSGPYIGRITGVLVADDVGATIYMTEGEYLNQQRLVIHDRRNDTIHRADVDQEVLRGWITDDETYIAACHELGMTPVIDL